jgi:hypothetical protein
MPPVHEITSETELSELLGELAAVPSRARIAQKLERPQDTVEDLERYYGPTYAAGLYPPS